MRPFIGLALALICHTNALSLQPHQGPSTQPGVFQRVAAVAAAAVFASSTVAPVLAYPLPTTLAIAKAEQSEEAALLAAITKAKALAEAQEKADLEAAKAAAKAESKALAARGTPAKLPASAAPSDVSIALRSGAFNLKDQRVPQSIGITLPVAGPIRIDFNAVVSKSTPEAVAEADIVLGLPKDLVKAGKRAAGGAAGVSLDVPGIAAGRLDVDLSTPRKGEADVAVTSTLIPKLPLQKTKGLGTFCFECGNPGTEQSDWFVARNLGNGVQFYGNAKTGVSQFEAPKGF